MNPITQVAKRLELETLQPLVPVEKDEFPCFEEWLKALRESGWTEKWEGIEVSR